MKVTVEVLNKTGQMTTGIKAKFTIDYEPGAEYYAILIEKLSRVVGSEQETWFALASASHEYVTRHLLAPMGCDLMTVALETRREDIDGSGIE